MSDFIQVSRKKNKPKKKKDPKQEKEDLAVHYLKMIKGYKVERCSDGYGRSFPFCPQGKQCFYAHSDGELRRNPLREGGGQRYTRGMCPNKDNCPSGKDCQFAHNDCETMYHPKTYKTKGCKHGSRCERGIYCAFKHDEDILTPDLRSALFFLREDDEDDGFIGDTPVDEAPSSSPGATPAGGPASKNEPPPLTNSEIEEQRKIMQQFEQGKSREVKGDSADDDANDEAARKALMAERKASADAAFAKAEAALANKTRQANEEAEKKAKADALTGLASSSAQHFPPLNNNVSDVTQQQIPSTASSSQNSAPGAPVSGGQPSKTPIGTSVPPNSNLNRNMPPSPGSASVQQQMQRPQKPPQQQQQQQQQQPSPSANSTPTLRPERMKSASIVLSLMVKLPQGAIEAEALLDILGCSDEGRFSADAQDNTALLHAVSRGLRRLVPALANARTINAPNRVGQTPLSIAIEGDDRDMVDELLRCGANLNLANSAGGGCLVHAITRNSMQCAFMLSNQPPGVVDLSLLDADGNSALALSAKRGFLELVDRLSVTAAPLVNVRNTAGETPLALACKMGHARVAMALLKVGADPNTKDNSGATPLLLALRAEAGLQCADLLLQFNNIDVKASDINGNSPLRVARQKNYDLIANKLIAMGAPDDHGGMVGVPGFGSNGILGASGMGSTPVGGFSPFGTDTLGGGGGNSGNGGGLLSGVGGDFLQGLAGNSIANVGNPQLCVMCSSRPPTTQCRPCNHVGLCGNCAKPWFQSSRSCPICQQPVQDASNVMSAMGNGY